MKRLLLMPLLTLCLQAQTSNTNAVLSPYGTWLLCEQPLLAETAICPEFGNVVPGNEPYLLLVAASRVDTVAFVYNLTVIAPDGTTRSFSGLLMRNDDTAHRITRSHLVLTTGRIKSAVITITELTASITEQYVPVVIGQ